MVILVDEYDKPMLQAIGNEELQKQFRNTLKPFYGALKTMDGCIKFAFLTGVTKFGKVSVFSDLNNLDDISMWNEYVEICGISEREIHNNLETELHEFAAARGITYDKLCEELRECYDGYHLRTILLVCTIRSVCLMLSNVRISAAIGLKRAHRPIW